MLNYPVDMLVAILAITIEDLVSDPDTLFEDSDETSDVVEFSLFQHTLFACAFIENLMNKHNFSNCFICACSIINSMHYYGLEQSSIINKLNLQNILVTF